MQKLLLSFFVVLSFSVVVGAVLFFQQSPLTQAQVSTATVASCQVAGFNRPLIFGVNPGDGAISEYEDGPGATLKNSGSTMATVALNWDVIQPNGPQDYDADAMVNSRIRKAVQSGRVVVVNLSGTPPWATGNPELLSLPDNAHNRKAQPNKANKQVNDEFKQLVTQAVRDNKDKVKYWSYWNEPNGCSSSKGDCGYTGDSLEDFAYWHKVFYDTVKNEDPTAKIIFANIDLTSRRNTVFIGEAHRLGETDDEIDIEYDYLGVNAYEKKKNAKLPIDWVKDAYEAQPSNYKKPIWLNEWGWDRQWWECPTENGAACREQARRDIAALVEDGLNKIITADYIFAAQYLSLRDVKDGDYGLWDSDAPRPGGTKFLEIVTNKCNPVFTAGGVVSPPPAATPACVVATNDTGGVKLKLGQPLTLTALATKPINTFKFSFYIPGSGGNPARQFCVAGAPEVEGDDCPAGSGPLVVSTSNNDQGVVQAVDLLKQPNNQVLQSFWKGNIGANRRVTYEDNFRDTAAVNWNFSNYITNLNIGGPFSPMAEIDAMATYSTNNQTMTMEIWRNNQMWYNTAPFTSDGSNIDWGKGSGWKMYKDFNSEADKAAWPGTGLVTARSSFVGKDNKLWHIYWRGDEEWARGVPIVNGNPNSSLLDNEPNKGFIRTRTLSELHTATNTTGKVQGLTHMVMPDGNVQEQLWINNQLRKRTIPLAASGPNFAGASTYQIISSGGVTPVITQSDGAASVSINYNDIHKNDAILKAIPDTLQVNATFVADDGTQIGNQGACVTRFTFDKGIPGDLNGNCMVDIYDYNILVENQGKTNCQYNITGDCKIDAQDISLFLPLYGNTCPAN